jgi:hypothetical protein
MFEKIDKEAVIDMLQQLAETLERIQMVIFDSS